MRPTPERAGKFFDGWFPIAPSASDFAAGLGRVRTVAQEHGRDPAMLNGAMYLTVALDHDAAHGAAQGAAQGSATAEDRLNRFLERYYGQPPAVLRRRQACYAGPVEGLGDWLDSYAEAGAAHLGLRFAGDHERHLSAVAKMRHV